AQPVMGLLHLSQDRAALESAAEAAEDGVRVAEAGVREDVQSGLLRLFEARALEGTARSGQEQLRDQVKLMQSRISAGTATNADLLRVQVALANSRQQEIQAEAQEQVSRAGLMAA